MGKEAKPMKKGEKIGRLTMLGISESRVLGQHKATYEKCVCECGTVKYVLRNHLRRGKIKSCGCLASDLGREKMIKMSTKHGFYGTRIYEIYQGIKRRCKYHDTDGYDSYGGRGITYKWDTFEDFYKDMGESYYAHVKEYGEKDTTIDRIDVNGNYCKENCRRATHKEQGNNRRNNRIVFYKGKKYTLMGLCDYMGIPNYILVNRLKLGWSVEDAVEKPIKKIQRHKTSPFGGEEKKSDK